MVIIMYEKMYLILFFFPFFNELGVEDRLEYALAGPGDGEF